MAEKSEDDPKRRPDSDQSGYPPPPPRILQSASVFAGAAAVAAGFLGYDQLLLILAAVSVALTALSFKFDGKWVADSDTTGYPPPPPPRPLFRCQQVNALLTGVAGVTAGFLGYDDVLLILTVVSLTANLASLGLEGWRHRRPSR